MFFLLLTKNNKKDATISSIITNITSTLLLLIRVFIIDSTFICNNSLKLLLNIKCKLTVKYAVILTLTINAIINNILLFIDFSYFFNSIIEFPLLN